MTSTLPLHNTEPTELSLWRDRLDPALALIRAAPSDLYPYADFSALATEDALDWAENATAPRCNVLTGCRDLLALGVFGAVYLVLAAGVLIVAVGVAVVERIGGHR